MAKKIKIKKVGKLKNEAKSVKEKEKKNVKAKVFSSKKALEKAKSSTSSRKNIKKLVKRSPIILVKKAPKILKHSKKVTKPIKKPGKKIAIAKPVKKTNNISKKVVKLVKTIKKPLKSSIKAKTIEKVKPKDKKVTITTIIAKPINQPAQKNSPKVIAKPIISKLKPLIKTALTISVPTITNKIAPAIANKKDKALSNRKDPKGKFILEYVVHASANILYEFVTSPSGLAEWFADDVNIRDGIYTFFWNGSQQQAKIIACKEPQFMRLKWMDKTDESYFEFRIETDDLTGDVSLLVADFADDDAEMRTSKLLWDNQVKKLLQILGSY